MIPDPPSVPVEREPAPGAVRLLVGARYGGLVRGSDGTPRRVRLAVGALTLVAAGLLVLSLLVRLG